MYELWGTYLHPKLDPSVKLDEARQKYVYETGQEYDAHENRELEGPVYFSSDDDRLEAETEIRFQEIVAGLRIVKKSGETPYGKSVADLEADVIEEIKNPDSRWGRVFGDVGGVAAARVGARLLSPIWTGVSPSQIADLTAKARAQASMQSVFRNADSTWARATRGRPRFYIPAEKRLQL